jgi:hypothetical protein
VCGYSLQSSNGTAPAAGGSGSVGVIAAPACAWSAASNDPSWLSITSSGGSGSSDVQFVVQPNPSAAPRAGTLTISGLTYTVAQPGAPCSYTLSSPNVSVSSDGITSATFTVTTGATGCSPLAKSYANWVVVNDFTFSGSSGTVTYSVDPNVSAMTRTGAIQLGDRTFTVNEIGSACGFSLNAYGIVFDHQAASGSVLGSPSALGCVPVTGTDQPSFVHLGTLVGPFSNIFTQSYAVDLFPPPLSPHIRRARITFGGQVFVIKQSSW